VGSGRLPPVRQRAGAAVLRLVSRVQADDPEFVVDLGCGPGNLTAALAERWPAARVQGVDSSPYGTVLPFRRVFVVGQVRD